MTLAVDISNYTGQITADQVSAWRDAGVGLVIVQAVDPPAGYPAGCTKQQIQTLNQAGMPVDAYVFFWFDSDPGHIDNALALLEGLTIHRVWLDLEDVAAKGYDQATTVAKVTDALQRCDNWSQAHNLPLPTGIYTGSWYWTNSAYMGNTQAFNSRDLWSASYDFIADASQGFVAYGGWTQCTIKQHIGSSAFCGVSGLDQDCLSNDYATLLGAAAPTVAVAEPAQVSCPAVPQAYQDKFGVGPDGWPAVAANLEGVIHQLVVQVQQATHQGLQDPVKLNQIRAIVSTYKTGAANKLHELAGVR